MPKLTAAQRKQLPSWSLAHNGWGDGSGYPGKRNNPACKYVGHGLEYSCADGATATYGHAGYPMLGGIQPGMAEGAAYVPDFYAFARKHKGGIRKSWNAQVGDLWLVDTGSGAQPGHVEVVYKVTDHGEFVMVYTVGWDSGPSNVDAQYDGQGGVHRHVWQTKPKAGNPACYAVVNADVLIDWSRRGAKPAKKPKPAPLSKTTTGQVTTLTHKLDNREQPVKGDGSRKHLRALRASITKALHRGSKKP